MKKHSHQSEPEPQEEAFERSEAVGSVEDQELADRIAACESRLGYVFRDKELLIAALTHASGAAHRLASNERLEFLGDAILGAVICERLFRQYPQLQEGELTRIKSAVVSRQTCARVSNQLKLGDFLIVGKGMAGGSAVPDSLLSDVFEALIAAIYLDGGSEVVTEFIDGALADEVEAVATGGKGGNYKSQLQQLVQREYGDTPIYQLLDERGPDHSKCFQVAAQVAGERYPAAWGRSKKEAEQRAASHALQALVRQPSGAAPAPAPVSASAVSQPLSAADPSLAEPRASDPAAAAPGDPSTGPCCETPAPRASRDTGRDAPADDHASS